tara:strand:- start:4054 stop:4602 length:549 start_codon:yes stop_codon:yes gene_type:complete
MTPIELIRQAISFGVKHIAVTDHHSVLAFEEIHQWLNDNYSKNNCPIKCWSGIEISSLLNNSLVHILGYGFDINSRLIEPYVKKESTKGQLLKAENIIEAIKLSGGFTFLAHPARYRKSYDELIKDSLDIGIDGIEVWYDYEHNKEWIPSNYICNKINSLCSSYNLLASCGTDSHGYSLKGR